MNVEELKAIFFDLGGTLFEHLPADLTRANLDACMQGVLLRSLTESEFADYQNIRHDQEAHYRNRPFFLHRDLVQSSFLRFAAETLDGQLEETCELARQFYRLQQTTVTNQLVLRTDTLTTLAALRSHGVLLAIVSNIDNDYLAPLLARTGLSAEFAFVLSSEEARSCKPDPAIYQQALARAQIAAEEVLFVGDSHANDVVGPNRLGFKTCWLIADQPVDARASQSADLIVSTLTELCSAFH